jgi:hypothetical protein
MLGLSPGALHRSCVNVGGPKEKALRLKPGYSLNGVSGLKPDRAMERPSAAKAGFIQWLLRHG